MMCESCPIRIAIRIRKAPARVAPAVFHNSDAHWPTCFFVRTASHYRMMRAWRSLLRELFQFFNGESQQPASGCREFSRRYGAEMKQSVVAKVGGLLQVSRAGEECPDSVARVRREFLPALGKGLLERFGPELRPAFHIPFGTEPGNGQHATEVFVAAFVVRSFDKIKLDG